MSNKYWKISDFAKNKHTNTIDGWFRNQESERKLHYLKGVDFFYAVICLAFKRK